VEHSVKTTPFNKKPVEHFKNKSCRSSDNTSNHPVR
jgi:hypothetical protein